LAIIVLSMLYLLRQFNNLTQRFNRQRVKINVVTLAEEGSALEFQFHPWRKFDKSRTRSVAAPNPVRVKHNIVVGSVSFSVNCMDPSTRSNRPHGDNPLVAQAAAPNSLISRYQPR
jgi:hypothetical protein